MKIYFTPGPTKVHPEIGEWFIEAQDVVSRSHRSSWFEELFGSLKEGLRTLLNIPPYYSVGFFGSATEVWERVSQLSQKSFHIRAGEFGKRWERYAKDLGIETSGIDLPPTFCEGFSQIKEIEDFLCLTLCETSTGFWLSDFKELRANNPNAVIAVDAVSAVPYANIDFNLVDVVLFSIQKGFCLPAGLGVGIFSPRIVERAKKTSIKTFHSIDRVSELSLKNQTAETPPVLQIFLLKKAVDKYLSLGIDRIRRETDEKEALLLSSIENYLPFIETEKYRSKTVLTFVGEGASTLRDSLEKKGIFIGSGFGDYKSTMFRIANFPSHTKEEYKQLIEAVKYCLVSL